MSGTNDRFPRAELDIHEQFEWYYDESGLGLAERFIDAVESSFELLARSPFLGVACNFSRSDVSDLRRFNVKKSFDQLIIIYRPTELGIAVVRVVHGHRDVERHI